MIGTWNMVNESKSPTNVNNVTKSGTITFTKRLLLYKWSFIEHVNGQTERGTWEFNDPTNTMINLCIYDIHNNPVGNCAYLTFIKIKPNHIELQDIEKELSQTIYLTR
jgi:hypothetical protein